MSAATDRIAEYLAGQLPDDVPDAPRPEWPNAWPLEHVDVVGSVLTFTINGLPFTVTVEDAS